MKLNSKQIALRDPAYAAAMGIHYEADPFGSEWCDDQFGAEYYGYGGRFGVDEMAPRQVLSMTIPSRNGSASSMPELHPAVVAQIVDDHQRKQACTSRREMMLNPNRNSAVDIERYDFSFGQSPNITLGVAQPLNFSSQPSVTFRPQRCTFNAPSFGFATIQSIQVANVSALVGSATDAAIYTNISVGISLDLPTLSPANKATVTGNYSGLTPPGFPVAFSYPFLVSFQGPATVVA